MSNKFFTGFNKCYLKYNVAFYFSNSMFSVLDKRELDILFRMILKTNASKLIIYSPVHNVVLYLVSPLRLVTNNIQLAGLKHRCVLANKITAWKR